MVEHSAYAASAYAAVSLFGHKASILLITSFLCALAYLNVEGSTRLSNFSI
jgi:hypothetical protein